eukprot:Sdes_comp20413_c0_seq6m14452
MESFQRLLGTANDEEAQEDTFMSELDNMCSLSHKTRIYGFGICFVVGWILSLFSTLSLSLGRVTNFAVLYSLGNVVSLSSSGFLVGPLRQLKTMFDPCRAISTLILLAALVGTLISAFFLHRTGLTLLCCLIEFGAMFWYFLSYIPFGRSLVSKFVLMCIPI